MVDAFKDPGIADGETSVYAATIGDDPTQHEVTAVVTDDGEQYRAVIEARMPIDFKMKVEQRFRRANGTLTADSYVSESWHGDKLVSREEGHFIETAHLQFGGKVEPFPSRMTPLLGAMTVFRGLDFAKGAKAKVDVWLAFSIFWPIEAKVEKRTEVEVPAGRFDAWQVKVRPSFAHINGLLDKVIGGILPPFVLHFDAGGSHRMLRFSFPTGPMPWNPKAVIALTKAG